MKIEAPYISRRANGIIAESPKKAMTAAKAAILCLMIELTRRRINCPMGIKLKYIYILAPCQAIMLR